MFVAIVPRTFFSSPLSHRRAMAVSPARFSARVTRGLGSAGDRAFSDVRVLLPASSAVAGRSSVRPLVAGVSTCSSCQAYSEAVLPRRTASWSPAVPAFSCSLLLEQKSDFKERGLQNNVPR
ncbi:unnamed protein product [Prorocentrum cordatum]|uniref:Uncharacterized protein n=1 Tax=Prorocentrum cordatum TaxID=2364126 RepID=A0ABN9TU32_9DINO|nr:unnamed protein product [Polarella glacialis]